MELVVVSLIVVMAACYALWKFWRLMKPGANKQGCSCSSAKSGCTGCPLVKP